VTFGFVARDRGSAGLRGARFQAVFGGSSSAGIGWNLWGMLPQSLPQPLGIAPPCQGAVRLSHTDRLSDLRVERKLASRRLRQA
jgi:hypothetical protein